MLKHIVLFKFKDEALGHTKEENLITAREKLLALPAIIDVVRSMEVGFDELHSEMSYDFALTVVFDSLEDMKTYRDHPAHVEVGKFMSAVREGRVVIDYNLE